MAEFGRPQNAFNEIRPAVSDWQRKHPRPTTCITMLAEKIARRASDAGFR